MPQFASSAKVKRFYPLAGACLYLVLGLSWIALSDHLLELLVSEPQLLARYQSYKGFFYIALTALLAWFLLKQRSSISHAFEHSEFLLEKTIENAAAGIAHVTPSGQFIKVNRELCRLLGYSKEELCRLSFQQITHPQDLVLDQDLVNQVLAGERQYYSIEKRYLHKEGHTIWARLSVAFVAPTNFNQAFFISVVQDISEVKQAQQQLEESELRFRTLLDSLPAISVQGYDEYGTTQYWNKGSELIYGYKRSEAIGQNLLDLIIPEYMHDGVKQAIQLMAESGEPRPAEELQLKRKDGSPITVYSSHAVIILPDRKPQIYCIDLDLTEYKKQEAELAFLAQYDPLTRLPNRHCFATKLEQALKLARRDNHQLAVLMLDLDNFKNINDSYGHKIGDLVLQQVASKLHMGCRETDTLARLGGDEFAILIEHLSEPDAAARFAQELITTLQQPLLVNAELELSTSVSIGIALFPQHHGTVETLFQGADTALYKAKIEGRSTYAYYNDQLTIEARKRLVLEGRLRQALKTNQLFCHFQPQVDLNTGKIVGAELLIRWQEPEMGMISPDQFIPVAESSGLIHAIGQLVLRQACELGQAWLAAGLPPIRLAVNVSAHQFSRGELVLQLQNILAETGFPATLLELEVTESALMQDEERVIKTLRQLREIGVRLAIDDFGTGYSSLAYLQRLPVDVLKVDRRFIHEMENSADNYQITKAIIELAHTLRFEVLAEGVETKAQLNILSQLNCHYFQGYLFSKPLPASQFETLLQQQADKESSTII